MGTRSFLRFETVDGNRLVHLHHIVECIPMVQIETDCGSKDSRYRGLLHYRGDVLPVFHPVDTGRPTLDPDWFLIIVEQNEQKMALVARGLDDIVNRPTDCCRRVEIGENQTTTVVSFEDDVVRVVEPAAVI